LIVIEEMARITIYRFNYTQQNEQKRYSDRMQKRKKAKPFKLGR